VTYNVENQGIIPSDAYQVDLYLSTDKTINPAAERLLKNVTFSTGLAPGESKKTTTKVLVPLNGLSRNYY
jgi:subtilase family serine protease